MISNIHHTSFLSTEFSPFCIFSRKTSSQVISPAFRRKGANHQNMHDFTQIRSQELLNCKLSLKGCRCILCKPGICFQTAKTGRKTFCHKQMLFLQTWNPDANCRKLANRVSACRPPQMAPKCMSVFTLPALVRQNLSNCKSTQEKMHDRACLHANLHPVAKFRIVSEFHLNVKSHWSNRHLSIIFFRRFPELRIYPRYKNSNAASNNSTCNDITHKMIS